MFSVKFLGNQFQEEINITTTVNVSCAADIASEQRESYSE